MARTHQDSVPFHASGNELAHVKNLCVPWNSSNLPNRNDEIILTRLRIGHTRLTNTHLVSQLLPLSCYHFNNELPLTIDQLFLCPRHLDGSSHERATTLKDNSLSIPNLFPYFRHLDYLSNSFIFDAEFITLNYKAVNLKNNNPTFLHVPLVSTMLLVFVRFSGNPKFLNGF